MKLNRTLLAASWRSWIAPDMTRVGPFWLQLVWTFLFCAAVALGFTILALFFGGLGLNWKVSAGTFAHWWGKNFIVSAVIGYLIHGLFELAPYVFGRPWLRSLKGWRASLFYAGVPLLGVLVGWPLGIYLALGEIPDWLWGTTSRIDWWGTALICLTISLMFHFYFSAKAKQMDAERRASQAQLMLLQAQMEPHFLFNTLANVQGLIEHEPRLAKQLLESFTDYLRATLHQLRQDDSTVGAELSLAESYLRLLATRMDERLRFTLNASERARAAAVPPLLLQPLVENAIRHGLEPQLEGGTVALSAQVSGQQLVLEVRDDGAGPHAAARRVQARPGGAGVALANLRERLLQRYGGAASFELHELAPGTLARITLPYEVAR